MRSVKQATESSSILVLMSVCCLRYSNHKHWNWKSPWLLFVVLMIMTILITTTNQLGLILSVHDENQKQEELMLLLPPVPMTTIRSKNDGLLPNKSNKTKSTFGTETTTSTSTSEMLLYRWSSASSAATVTNLPFKEQQHGISIQPILQYIQFLFQHAANHSNNNNNNNHDMLNLYGPIPVWIGGGSNNLGQVRVSLPIYIKRHTGLIKKRRMEFVGPFLQQAVRQFITSSSLSSLSNSNSTTTSFPHLTRALLQDGGGLLLLLDMGDFSGCIHNNYNYTHSSSSSSMPNNNNNIHNSNVVTTTTTTTTIPLFTMSVAPTCPDAFPIPSYTVLQMALPHGKDWDQQYFHDSDTLYPWSRKKRQAIWRGSITGLKKGNGDLSLVPRMKLAMMGNGTEPSLDVAISCKFGCKYSARWREGIRIVEYSTMEDFQNYRAIIDMDGNSWSERFPRLLCMNSVVIKVDPEQVDYFWPTLQAGVHYLRAENLTHLLQVARYATSDEHEEEMQGIVSNARSWCRERMVVKQVQSDLLSVLDGYAKLLYQADPTWHQQIGNNLDVYRMETPMSWKKKKKKVVSHLEE